MALNDKEYEMLVKMLATIVGDDPLTYRWAVDSQQQSFEDGTQFRMPLVFNNEWYSSIGPIPANGQLVLKFTASNPLNVISRTPEITAGSIAYLVFPDNGNVTFDDNLLSPLPQITNINTRTDQNSKESLSSSGVTIEYYIGASAFTSTDWPRNFTFVKTDNSSQRATNQYGPNDIKAGVADGLTFYLVLDNPDNSEVEGGLIIAWEETFNG